MSISVDEIIKIHLKNGLKNSNRTMNAFMIYRYCYQKNNALRNSNLPRNDASKLASESWKSESDDIKNYYRRMAENVKRGFKKKVNSLCFIHSKLAGNNNKETNPSIVNLNSQVDRTTSYNNLSDSSSPIYSPNIPNITYLYPPMEQSFLGINCPNSLNINQNTPDTADFDPHY